jgi:hypothetical protein
MLIPFSRHSRKTIRARRNAFRPGVESCEARQLMAASLTASLTPSGQLYVEGTDARDVIVLRQTGSAITIDGLSSSFNLANVSSVAVSGLGGDDFIELSMTPSQVVSINATLIGGDGNDLIEGGAGNDAIWGDGGNDILWGGAGDDCLYGGSGDDCLFGDDGSDVLCGEAGRDAIAAGSGSGRVDDGDGAVAVLRDNGLLLRYDAAGNGTLLGGDQYPVKSFAVDGGGQVVLFGAAGRLFRVDAAGHGTVLDGQYPVTSYAIDGGGQVVLLDTGGRLFRVDAAGHGTLLGGDQYPVKSFVVDGGGQVDLFDDHGRLFRVDSAGHGTVMDSYPVTSFAVDNTGQLVSLDDHGRLFRFDAAGHATVLDGQYPVTSFVVDGSGQVASLDTGGRLFRYDAGGHAIVMDSHAVTTFAIDGGQLVSLDTAGRLFRFDAAGHATFLDSNPVAALTILTFGGVQQLVSLDDHGQFLRYDASGHATLVGNLSPGIAVADFGAPVGKAADLGARRAGWWGQEYQNGAIYTNGTEFLALSGKAWDKYKETGRESGSLGLPKSNASDYGFRRAGLQYQEFQGGAILTDGVRTALVLGDLVTIRNDLGNSRSVTFTNDTAHGGQTALAILEGNGELSALGTFGTRELLASAQSLSDRDVNTATIQVGPFLQADFAVQWAPGASPTVAFTDVRLDVGAFTSNVLASVVNELQRVTSPMRGTADQLLAPLPFVSDLTNAFKLGDYTLARLYGDLSGCPDQAAQLTAFASAVRAINALPTGVAGAGWADLGAFTGLVTAPGAMNVVNAAPRDAVSQLGGVASLVQQLRQIGVSLPVLDDATNLFRVVAGANTTLFSYSLPGVDLNYDVTHQQLGSTYTVVVPPGIPVDFRLFFDTHLHVSAGANLGADTSGLRGGNPAHGFFVQNAHLSATATVVLTGEASVGSFDAGALHIDSPSVVSVDVSASLILSVNAVVTGAEGSGTVRLDQLLAGQAGLGVSGSISGRSTGTVSYSYVSVVQLYQKVGETWKDVFVDFSWKKILQDVYDWVTYRNLCDNLTYTLFDTKTGSWTF